ncbi:MAG: metallophosphoesterase [Deltaproteobacteria bacterium]|nr:metallophosphoesterase [Deltaproteobacteria bacterium]
MIVGILSDSHDNLPVLDRMAKYFNEQKVGFVIHAGDFVAPFALKAFEELRCPWIGVFGNNDGEQGGLTKMSQGRIQPAPYGLNLDGKKVVVVHDLASYSKEEFASKAAEVVIHGHTHEPEIKKEGDILFINPGELGGWVNGRCTVVLLDTKTMETRIEEI